MNYDEVAKKLLDDVCRYLQCDHCLHVGGWRETRGETCPNNAVGTIAAALRRAANEAARDGYEGGREFERADTSKQAMALKHELTAKYGPKEARDESQRANAGGNR